MTAFVLDIILLFLLVVSAVAAISVRSLLASSMFLAIYSLLMAQIWVHLQAVDVAFTEAAVGAGISTVLLVGTLVFVKTNETPAPLVHWPSLAAVVITGAVLVYGTFDMPPFGDPSAPANLHVANYYISHSLEQTHVPNFVTSVLASYRGYDTLFETAVIFTAGISLILLLRQSAKQKRRKKHEK